MTGLGSGTKVGAHPRDRIKVDGSRCLAFFPSEERRIAHHNRPLAPPAADLLGHYPNRVAVSEVVDVLMLAVQLAGHRLIRRQIKIERTDGRVVAKDDLLAGSEFDCQVMDVDRFRFPTGELEICGI